MSTPLLTCARPAWIVIAVRRSGATQVRLDVPKEVPVAFVKWSSRAIGSRTSRSEPTLTPPAGVTVFASDVVLRPIRSMDSRTALGGDPVAGFRAMVLMDIRSACQLAPAAAPAMSKRWIGSLPEAARVCREGRVGGA